MKRVLFFHNRHDANSTRLLAEYSGNPELSVEVYDVFAVPPPKIPEKIRLWKLPFVVCRKFVLLEPLGMEINTPPNVAFTVRLGCFDLEGNPADMQEETDRVFHVYVNDVLYSDKPQAEADEITGKTVPVLAFGLVAGASTLLRFRVDADGYVPFDEVIKVVVN